LWLLGNDSTQLVRGIDGYVAATPVMPMKGVIVAERKSIDDTRESLEQRGTWMGDESHLAASRVLAGWPSLGREIDEKTLPQEVRFDELGAVSYSKGCYTGQETVARVHFRGHPNRQLRGLVFPRVQISENRTITMEGKEVGFLRTTVQTNDRTMALATLRREVPEDAMVQLDVAEARVTSLPVGQGVAV
jgi:folate-binding protein YgfZ